MGNQLTRDGVNSSQTRQDYANLQNMGSQYADLAVDAGLAAAGALPPPFGTVADVGALGKSLWRGDWGGALMDAVGIIPIFGDGVKAAKIADRLNDLRKSIDVTSTAVARAFNQTRATATKYWDDIVQANRQKWRDALANCGGTQACKDAAALQKGPQYRNTPTSDKGTWNPPEGRGDGVFTPANGGPPITYKNGFPDYSSHSVADVDIPMTGNRTTDFDLADEAMLAKDPNWQKPSGYTWHHHEDGVTMQLIPSNIHGTGSGAMSPHMGGAALYGNGSQATAF